MPWAPTVSKTNGGSTGLVSTVASQLDAARADWQRNRALAEERWEAYQKTKRRRERNAARESWQAAETDAIQAGKRYAAALRAAEEACEGQRGG